MKKISLNKLFYLINKFARSLVYQDKQLIKLLGGLINKSISEEQYLEWFNKNQTILNDILKYDFRMYHAGSDSVLVATINYATNTDIYICLEDKLEDPYKNFKLIQESKLINTNIIPVLYIFIVKTIYVADSIGDVNKDLAHNPWLIKVYSSLFYTTILDTDTIEKFYKDNKNKIDSIKKMFSVAIPKYLGQGADGIAFSIGNKKIIKFFTSTFVYNKTLEAMKRLHDNPEIAKTEAMIYDLGTIGKVDNEALYYYIMEQMKPVDDLENSLDDRILSIARYIKLCLRDHSDNIDGMKFLLDKPKEHDELRKLLNETTERIVDQIRNSFGDWHLKQIKDEANLKDNWLKLYIEELIMKYITNRLDVHMGNLGISNDELRYYDPSHDFQNRTDFNI